MILLYYYVVADERSDVLLTPQTRTSRVFPARVPIIQQWNDERRRRSDYTARPSHIRSDPFNVGQSVIDIVIFSFTSFKDVTKRHFRKKKLYILTFFLPIYCLPSLLNDNVHILHFVFQSGILFGVFRSVNIKLQIRSLLLISIWILRYAE